MCPGGRRGGKERRRCGQGGRGEGCARGRWPLARGHGSPGTEGGVGGGRARSWDGRRRSAGSSIAQSNPQRLRRTETVTAPPPQTPTVGRASAVQRRRGLHGEPRTHCAGDLEPEGEAKVRTEGKGRGHISITGEWGPGRMTHCGAGFGIRGHVRYGIEPASERNDMVWNVLIKRNHKQKNIILDLPIRKKKERHTLSDGLYFLMFRE